MPHGGGHRRVVIPVEVLDRADEHQAVGRPVPRTTAPECGQVRELQVACLRPVASEESIEDESLPCPDRACLVPDLLVQLERTAFVRAEVAPDRSRR